MTSVTLGLTDMHARAASVNVTITTTTYVSRGVLTRDPPAIISGRKASTIRSCHSAIPEVDSRPQPLSGMPPRRRLRRCRVRRRIPISLGNTASPQPDGITAYIPGLWRYWKRHRRHANDFVRRRQRLVSPVTRKHYRDRRGRTDGRIRIDRGRGSRRARPGLGFRGALREQPRRIFGVQQQPTGAAGARHH